MKKIMVIILFATGACLLSCGDQQQPAPDHKEEQVHEEEHKNTNTATLTQEQIKSIGIEFGNIEEKQLSSSLKANGVLKVPNQNKASVNSVYSGVIQSLLVQPGNAVKKGQVLATLANPSYMQVQDEYLNINSRIILAEQEYNRQKELNAGNAGALKNLQSAEADLRSLSARKASLRQQIQLMGINADHVASGELVSVLTVRSPISGVVSNVMVEIGTYLNATTPLLTIVDNSQLHLDLFVYEKDLPKLKNNQHIHFTLTNNPGKEYDAQIYSLGSSFEGESKAVTVHAEVQGNKTGLIEGMNVTAIVSLEKATVPAVPSEAIVNTQGQDFIFVVADKEEHHTKKDTVDHASADAHDHQEGGKHTAGKEVTFEKIAVAKGTSHVGYTEITLLKEVPKEAKIVVKGAFFVLAKMTNTGEEAHEH